MNFISADPFQKCPSLSDASSGGLGSIFESITACACSLRLRRTEAHPDVAQIAAHADRLTTSPRKLCSDRVLSLINTIPGRVEPFVRRRVLVRMAAHGLA